MKKYWNSAYSALWVLPLQSLNLTFHCDGTHAIPSMNGKGISEIVSLGFFLKHRLKAEFHFDIYDVEFGGYSCFTDMNHEFHLSQMDTFRCHPPEFPKISVRPVVIYTYTNSIPL
jgi:hypothetical protein